MLNLIWWVVIGLFRSRASLEAEIVALRHQLNVLRRKSPKRLAFNNFDRLIFAGLYRIAPRIVNALAIVEPATVIRWHRCWFSFVLAMEIASSGRQTEGGTRNPAIDPRHQPRQPALGCAPDPGRGYKLTVAFIINNLELHQNTNAVTLESPLGSNVPPCETDLAD